MRATHLQRFRYWGRWLRDTYRQAVLHESSLKQIERLFVGLPKEVYMIKILDLITMVGITIDENEQQTVIVNDDGRRLTNDEALKHLRGKLESGQFYYESLNQQRG